jgi:hypothetical protein
MTLHTHKDAYEELLTLAAEKLGIERYKVEKDYWVCKILREVAISEYGGKVYFKGGTSLSKGYGLIDRFSEDLDLFAYSGNPSGSKTAEKRIVADVSHFLIENNSDFYRDDEAVSGGNFRKLPFLYSDDTSGTGLKQHLEVELKCCDLADKSLMYYPFERRTIAPIVTQFLQSIGNTELIEKFALEPFGVNCIDPRKTLCDKISRMVRCSYADDYISQIAKNIRDVYDLHQLYGNAEIREFLHSEAFGDSIQSVFAEDEQNSNYPKGADASRAILFRDPEAVFADNAILTAYTEGLGRLVYNRDKMPSVADVVKTMREYAKILINR